MVAVFLTVHSSSPSMTSCPTLSWRRSGRFCQGSRCHSYKGGLQLAIVYTDIQVKGEESQTAEVVNVEALLPQERDYLTYQVDILIWI